MLHPACSGLNQLHSRATEERRPGPKFQQRRYSSTVLYLWLGALRTENAGPHDDDPLPSVDGKQILLRSTTATAVAPGSTVLLLDDGYCVIQLERIPYTTVLETKKPILRVHFTTI